MKTNKIKEKNLSSLEELIIKYSPSEMEEKKNA